jgi:hypothetical protein
MLIETVLTPARLSVIMVGVSALSFVDSMTGHLAWPVFAFLALWILRSPLRDLIGRVRHVKWREAEADLDSIVRAGQDVQEAASDTVKEFPEVDREKLQDSVERLLLTSVEWGFALGKDKWMKELPELTIHWDEEGRPAISISGAAMESYRMNQGMDLFDNNRMLAAIWALDPKFPEGRGISRKFPPLFPSRGENSEKPSDAKNDTR